MNDMINMITFLLSFALLSIAGWILLIMGIRSRREARLRENTEHTRTTGVIVDHVLKIARTGRNGGSNIYYKPVVEFSAEGQDYHLEYGNYMDHEKYPVGKTIDILYDVSDPTHFHLEEDPMFLGHGGAVRIGILWIIASAVFVYVVVTVVYGERIDFGPLWQSIADTFNIR